MASTKLSRTQESPTENKKFTVSCWFKPAQVANEMKLIYADDNSTNNYTYIHFSDTSGRIRFQNRNGGSNNTELIFQNNIRDFSSWYHMVMAVDSTQTTASDRVKFYLNGVQYTDLDPGQNTYPPINQTFTLNSGGYDVEIGASNSSSYFNGVMSQFIFIDGVQYAASTFGSTNATSGEWTPNPNPTISEYGNNGFKLSFEDTAALGDDTSGKGNDLAVSGSGTPTLDCPSNNMTTLNPIAQYGSNQGTLSNGNTSWVWSNYQVNARSTLGMPKGKFYWEQKCLGDEGSNRIGMCTSAFSSFIDTDSANAHYNAIGNGGIYLMMSAASTSWQRTNNDTSNNIDTYTYAAALATGDIIMSAVDVDAGKYWVGINGTWMYSGNPATGANAQITFTNSGGDDLQVFCGSGTNNSRSFSFNFGNGYFGTTAVTTNSGNGYAGTEGASKFNYQPPTGYSAINTKGLNL